MKSGWTAVAVAAALALAGPAGADEKAKFRDGGGGAKGGGGSSPKSAGSSSGGGGSQKSGGSSGGARERHPSSSGARSRGEGSSSRHEGTASRNEGSSRWSAPPTTEAQRRHPRPGTGTGDRGFQGRSRYSGGSSYSYSPYYRTYGYYRSYDPWYYDPFYSGYYGYSPWNYGGYWAYSPSRYRYGAGYGYRDSGSLRVIAEPEETRVYVDGYYAGIADDFDGIFQRLYLPPGRHEISLKLDGHQTHRFKVYVPVDQTIKIHHVMVRGAGETEDVVGSPLDDDRDDRWSRDDRRDDGDRDDRDEGDRDDRSGRDDRGRYGRDDRDDRRRAAPEDERDNAEAGTLRLDVRPSDASVYVDGQFRGTGRQADRLRLAPGRHRIEVVRPGYRTVEKEIEVGPGDMKDLEVELTRN